MYVDQKYYDQLPEPVEAEEDMLDQAFALKPKYVVVLLGRKGSRSHGVQFSTWLSNRVDARIRRHSSDIAPSDTELLCGWTQASAALSLV